MLCHGLCHGIVPCSSFSIIRSVMMLYKSIAFLAPFLRARFREAAGRFVLRPCAAFVLPRPSLTRTRRRTRRFAIAKRNAARPCQSERTPPTCGGAAEPLAAGMGADLGASDAACEARAGGS